MIQKKVISQTIPTFYTTNATADKNDLDSSCENFSLLTSNAVPLASSQTSSGAVSNSNTTTPKTISTKMEPSIKSVNYFGLQFNSNRNKSNDSNLSSNNNMNNTNGNLTNHSNNINMHARLENNRSPSQMYRKSQQTSFQKYVIEKQVRQHFNHRNSTTNHENDPSTKLMISKILNGDLESTQLTTTNSNLNNKNVEVSSRMNKMVLLKFFFLSFIFKLIMQL